MSEEVKFNKTILKLNSVDFSFEARKIFTDLSFSIRNGEHVALVGPNGVGKTTLFNLILGRIKPDRGQVSVCGNVNYVPQVDDNLINDEKSAGQKRLELIENTIWMPGSLLLLDEPTVYLDRDNCENLYYLLRNYDDAILVASHDMDFINEFCTRTIILQPNKIIDFPGNYADYQHQLQLEKQTINNFNQKRQIDEERITAKISTLKDKDKSFNRHKKSAKELSQGRYPSRSKDRIQRSLSQRVKRAQKELSKLPKQAKIYQHQVVLPIFKRKIAKSHNYDFEIKQLLSPNNELLLEKTKFSIFSGEKVALLGPNGSGKTTLLKYLAAQFGDQAVYIGFNGQNSSKQTVEDFFQDTILSKTEIKRLLVKMEMFVELNTQFIMLSGGELAKLALLRSIYLNKAKVLLIDEPTNYLDPESVNALADMLKQSQLTCVIASHNEKFLNRFCNRQYKIIKLELQE